MLSQEGVRAIHLKGPIDKEEVIKLTLFSKKSRLQEGTVLGLVLILTSLFYQKEDRHQTQEVSYKLTLVFFPLDLISVILYS